jgi:hypothetical protein
MDLFESSYDLLEKLACFLLLHTTICHNVIKQLASRSVLHDQIQLSPSFDDFIQLYYVWMLNQLQNMNLSRNTFNIGHLNDPLLFQDLYRHTLTCEYMCTKLDLAECPLANGLTQDVMADGFGPRSH